MFYFCVTPRWTTPLHLNSLYILFTFLLLYSLRFRFYLFTPPFPSVTLYTIVHLLLLFIYCCCCCCFNTHSVRLWLRGLGWRTSSVERRGSRDCAGIPRRRRSVIVIEDVSGRDTASSRAGDIRGSDVDVHHHALLSADWCPPKPGGIHLPLAGQRQPTVRGAGEARRGVQAAGQATPARTGRRPATVSRFGLIQLHAICTCTVYSFRFGASTCLIDSFLDIYIFHVCLSVCLGCRVGRRLGWASWEFNPIRRVFWWATVITRTSVEEMYIENIFIYIHTV